jgi:hypothetical protein
LPLKAKAIFSPSLPTRKALALLSSFHPLTRLIYLCLEKRSGTDFQPDLFNGFEELLCAIVLNKLKTEVCLEGGSDKHYLWPNPRKRGCQDIMPKTNLRKPKWQRIWSSKSIRWWWACGMTSMQLIEKSFVGSSKFLAAAFTTYIHSSREIGLSWMYGQLLLPKSQPPTTEKHEQQGTNQKTKKDVQCEKKKAWSTKQT